MASATVLNRNIDSTVKRLIREGIKLSANELADNLIGADYDLDDREVFQWFVVSKYLAEELREVGAVVYERHKVYFWGRREYGIPLSADCELIATAKVILSR